MTDTDEIARLRALWCEEKSKSMTFHAEVERLRAEVAALKAERYVLKDANAYLAGDAAAVRMACDTITAERDEAQLQLQRIRCEISCRVEHGADSNGHLEGILAMLKQEAKP
jgi:hypothetical protein